MAELRDFLRERELEAIREYQRQFLNPTVQSDTRPSSTEQGDAAKGGTVNHAMNNKENEKMLTQPLDPADHPQLLVGDTAKSIADDAGNTVVDRAGNDAGIMRELQE